MCDCGGDDRANEGKVYGENTGINGGSPPTGICSHSVGDVGRSEPKTLNRSAGSSISMRRLIPASNNSRFAFHVDAS